jgi:cyclophilin family peptidyl-prolyl cis-trans isomerase
VRRFALAAAAVLLLAGCGSSKQAATTSTTTTVHGTAPHGCVHVNQPPPGARRAPKPTKALDPSKTYDVVFTTNCGVFTIRLAVKQAPKTAASFANLVQRKFFDQTVFHRIAVGFVIQGGDPTASGLGGPGYTVVEKPPASTKYTLGVAAMAKSQNQPAGASGSQFFVVTAQDAQLPPEYALLGKVVSGLPVVERIGKLGNANEQPTAIVEIQKATLHVG